MLLTFVGGLVGQVAPAAAQVSVPDPGQSTTPSEVLVSATGACCFDVVVRGARANPIAGSVVSVDFGGCTISFCPVQPPGTTVNVPTQTAMAMTDASGRAHLCVCATLTGSCQATISADGAVLATVPVAPCPPTQLLRNYTPPAWQAADVAWVGDVSPRNKVDDAIDAGSGSFEIIVNYRRCTTAADAQALLAMSPGSSVKHVSKYLSSIFLGSVPRAKVFAIAALADVAFIEQQPWGGYLLDVSVPSICVTTGSPSCDCDVRTAHGLTGAGRTIVIMDSGVDNHQHEAFAATTLVAGVDLSAYPTVSFTDPDDVFGHGTHVASIALGQGTVSQSPGVAPSARLVDVGLGLLPPAQFALAAQHALEVVYDHAAEWQVDVVNMSFGFVVPNTNPAQPLASDGMDAFSQLVDLAESMNIIVVAAVGNYGPANTVISSPAAATRALTVGGSNDQGTLSRGDDGQYVNSSKGTRSDDGDLDVLDELKPEVAAPAVAITAALNNTADGVRTADGTSMAAPHVAGLVALIRERAPMINAGSVKQLVIGTAELHGTPSAPLRDPTWNRFWGWGLVDACAAIAALGTGCDVGHPGHPAEPGWMSTDISTSTSPTVGQETTALVNVKNFGACQAENVRVHFGVHVYSAATPTFYDIGTKVVNVPPGQTVQVAMPWVPQAASHQCLRTEIAWGPDTESSNNRADRNFTVANSPVYFTVRNTRTEAPALITLVPTIVPGPGSPSGWTITLDPPSVTLGAADCEQVIRGELTPPPGAPVGATATAHIAAMVAGTEIGGVSFVDSVTTATEAPALTWGTGASLIGLLGIGLFALFARRRRRDERYGC